MSVNKETIILKRYNNIQEERKAGEDLYPGHLIEVTSGDNYQKHSTVSGTAFPIFAIEDALQGNSISDVYSSSDNDIVRGWIAQRGDHALGVLADGEVVSIGDFLESAGDGTLQKFGTNSVYDPSSIVGMANEAMDLSGSAGAESSAALDYPRNRISVTIL